MNNAANALRQLATDNLTEGATAWADDEDMLEMTRSDSADFVKVAELLEAGRNDEAEAYLDHMDTSPRERAYEAIQGKPFDGEEVLVIKKADLGRIRELVKAHGLLDELQALGVEVYPLELS